MFWFKKKEEPPKKVYTSKFQKAWMCDCGYLTPECRFNAGQQRDTYCRRCGKPTHLGFVYIGKWTYHNEEDGFWGVWYLISFEFGHAESFGILDFFQQYLRAGLLFDEIVHAVSYALLDDVVAQDNDYTVVLRKMFRQL